MVNNIIYNYDTFILELTSYIKKHILDKYKTYRHRTKKQFGTPKISSVRVSLPLSSASSNDNRFI